MGLMTIQEQYIEKVLLSLSSFRKKKFRDGWGYEMACPFCRDAQKRESKAYERCAALMPLAGSYQWVFTCQRGLHGGIGNQRCDKAMRFDSFLREWNPPLYRKFVAEKEAANRNYQPKFF